MGKEQRAPLQAVLFDMDGTVADTEPLWFEAESSYVSQFQKTWRPEDSTELVGGSARTTTLKLAEVTGSAESHEEIFGYLVKFMIDAISSGHAQLRPGISELFADLKAEGIPIALVTSSVRPMVDAFLSTVPKGTFDAVVTANDVENHKPDPEPYLRAADMLGVDPGGCVVLEDSPSGIGSGLAAGARVVAIPCMVPLPAQDRLSRVWSAADLDSALLEEIAGGSVVDWLDD